MDSAFTIECVCGGNLLRKAITKATKETETNRIIKTETFLLPETTITKLKQGWRGGRVGGEERHSTENW